jgi:hypothetical protein
MGRRLALQWRRKVFLGFCFLHKKIGEREREGERVRGRERGREGEGGRVREWWDVVQHKQREKSAVFSPEYDSSSTIHTYMTYIHTPTYIWGRE